MGPWRSCFSRMAQCRGSDQWGPFPTHLTASLGMTEHLRRTLQQALIYAYISAVSAATLGVLALREWDIPAPFPSKFWNAIAAFVILGVVSESFSFTIPVANVRTSVSFVPFIASVALFQHPWPMLIGGLTALVADTFVRHKPLIRVWFNTAQFMLASGLCSWVYTALGGSVSLERFTFLPFPFACLVIVYFLVNHGSVARSEEHTSELQSQSNLVCRLLLE